MPIPAWSATTEASLNAPAFGFDVAHDVLRGALPPQADALLDARQAAFAEYSPTGFRAAAATGVLVAYGIDRRTQQGLQRAATIRFSHPYAIVAVARPGLVARVPTPWSGLPIFGGWVAKPD